MINNVFFPNAQKIKLRVREFIHLQNTRKVSVLHGCVLSCVLGVLLFILYRSLIIKKLVMGKQAKVIVLLVLLNGYAVEVASVRDFFHCFSIYSDKHSGDSA